MRSFHTDADVTLMLDDLQRSDDARLRDVVEAITGEIARRAVARR